MKSLDAGRTELIAEVRQFVASLPPIPRDLGFEGHFRALVDVQRRLHEAGLAIVGWPVKYGGRGLGPEAGALVSWQLGREECPEIINFLALDVVAPGLMRYATDEQLARWLPGMAPAEEIWCQLFSEPDAGSDLAALRTVAQPQGDGSGSYVVSGSKVWSTWAQFADRGLLLARTGGVDGRHRSITAFVVDMNSPGISVRPLRSITGSDEFAEVFLDGVVVPAEDIVGEVDGGWSVAMTMLSAERGTYPVRRSSVLAAALARVRRVARGRTMTQVEVLEIVDASIALQLLEWRTTELVAGLARGDEIGPESGIIKMLLTRAEQAIRAAALTQQGTAGVLNDCDHIVEDWLYSRAASIYGGSAQIQRNVLAERLLGLPR